MKGSGLIFKAGILFFSGLAAAVSVHAQSTTAHPHKTVFIIADGIPADVIERLDLPNMKGIAKIGAYKRAYVGGIKGSYSEMPTVSAPGYNNLLTGTWANKHNVWDNEIPAPNYHYATIFRFFKEAHPTGKTAIFSTWTDNRTKLVGEGLPATGQQQLDYAYDGFEKDTVNFPHDAASLHLHRIDEHVVAIADTVIREKAPDLSWIYLEYTDDVGHYQGTGAAFDTAVRMLDKQISRIWAAVKYRQDVYQEDWQLILTTDHGRDSVTGEEHGYQSQRERTTWIITNKNNGNDYFREFQPAIVDLLPTIARHLSVNIPEENSRELDGVPLSGPVSLAGLRLERKGKSIAVTWKALEKMGTVKILLSTTNLFREGGHDQYRELAVVPLGQGRYSFPLTELKGASFCKIVAEGKDNRVNQWLVLSSTGKTGAINTTK